MSKIKLLAILLLCCLYITGCVRNEPWRTGAIGNAVEPGDRNVCRLNVTDAVAEAPSCADGGRIDSALVEDYDHDDGSDAFELAFVEYTERGNLFDSTRARFVLDRLRQHALEPRGTVMVVFVHGWKNNASTANNNVRDFRELLSRISEQRNLLIGKRLVGLYVGWRGMSVSIPGIVEASFWDRKAVAEKVGKGGVTDLLLELEDIDAMNDENVLAIVGHSFGGAIVLSAFSEIVLNRVHRLGRGRVIDHPVADAVVLLNPAIEANQILHIKEAVLKYQPWPAGTPNLMRVISTRSDYATHRLFPLGQFFGVELTWDQDQLYRPYLRDARLHKRFHERYLDRQTVGNFIPFHTDEIVPPEESEKNMWGFVDLCADQATELQDQNPLPRLECSSNDPVKFVYTTREFMRGHSDIFNSNVSAYLTSTIVEVDKMNEPAAETAAPETTAVRDEFADRFRGLRRIFSKVLQPQ